MTFSQPLRVPFERWLSAFETGLASARSGDPGAVHRSLDTARALRELLRLCRSEVSRAHVARARRELRHIVRALERVAGADRVQDLVADLRVGERLEASRLDEEIAQHRQIRQARLRHRLAVGPVRRLERDLADVARGLGLREQSDGWVQTLAWRIERRVRRLRTVVAAAGALYDGRRIARVGVAARKLQVVLSVAADTGEVTADPEACEVERVAALLTRLHDLERLRRLVDQVADAEPRIGPDARLDTLRMAIEGTCRELHRRYVDRQPALLQSGVWAETHALGIWVERGGRRPQVPLIVPRGRAVKMSAARGGGRRRHGTGG